MLQETIHLEFDPSIIIDFSQAEPCCSRLTNKVEIALTERPSEWYALYHDKRSYANDMTTVLRELGLGDSNRLP